MALRAVTVREGEKYCPKYETMLRKMVSEHSDMQLSCLGGDRPLRTEYTGWWAKMELFAPWNADLRPCVYFDLDTYILKNLEDFQSFLPEELWLIRDFGSVYHRRPERSNSGMMLIPKDTTEIWNNHFSSPTKVDGDFLNKQPHKIIQDRFGGVVSYKWDPDPQRGTVVCFHGKPKPHETGGWAKEVWDGYTNPAC